MITVKNLSKKFGDFHVLKDISTTIHKGDIISIIGHSGSGKSTFLKCLNLLDPPDSGRIELDRVDILTECKNLSQVRRRIGMVFQTFCLFKHLTVLENVTIGPIKVLKRSKQEAEAAGMQLLRIVGLAEKCHHYPPQLSGGQEQRVEIARCLSVEPEIILFDEPTSALDPIMVSEVMGVIRKLAEQEMTMMIVTHDMNFAKAISTRIFYFDEGALIEEGTPDEIFNASKNEKTRRFILKVKSLSYRVETLDYDWYNFSSEIYAFCNKHAISTYDSNKLVLIIEEILQLLPINGGVDFFFDFSEETKTLHCTVVQNNCTTLFFDETIEMSEMDLSKTIIKGMCKKIEEKNENKATTIVFTI